MIIVISDKTFVKRGKKLVQPKDFLIADCTEDYDGILSEFGNRSMMYDWIPTPTLKKIASDPDSREAKIKMRALPKHLETWMSDDSFMMRAYYFVNLMVDNWYREREDINIFAAFRKREYALVAGPMVQFLNETYGMKVAYLIGAKMDKKEQINIASIEPSESFMKALAKQNKRIRKSFNPERLKELYTSST